MHRRILTSLIVVFASASLVLVVPVAHGKPVSTSQTSLGPIDPWQQNLNARVRYERAQLADPWMRNLLARQAQLAGKHPTPSQPASSTSGLDRTDAAIGAGLLFGVLLIGTASLVTIRRQHRPVAH